MNQDITSTEYYRKLNKNQDIIHINYYRGEINLNN